MNKSVERSVRDMKGIIGRRQRGLASKMTMERVGSLTSDTRLFLGVEVRCSLHTVCRADSEGVQRG